MNVCVPVNPGGIVPSAPVTAVPLQAHQDNSSFSSLNRPGDRLSQPTAKSEGATAKVAKVGCKLFEKAVAGTAPSAAGGRLSLYSSELNYCSQPERGWVSHSTPHMQMKVCACANHKYSFC